MPAASAVRQPRSASPFWRMAATLALPLLAALTLLAGCGPTPGTFAPYCPTPRRLADASQLTVYRPGSLARDVTDLVLQAEIVDVSGVCKNGDKGTVQVDTSVSFRFTRGPVMPGQGIIVPYLVTITLGDAIREQQAFRIQVAFPSNISTVTLTADPIHMVFPVTKTTNAASYTIWAAFQLTPEQLEYNRQRGR
jgi:hypothetical protein